MSRTVAIALMILAGAAYAGPVLRFSQFGTAQINGEFKAIAVGEGTWALLRLDGSLLIPPGIHHAENIPPGPYTAVSCGGPDDDHEWVVAIREDGTLTGSGYNFFGTLTLPAGSFVEVSAGGFHGIARRADGTLAGWGNLGPGAPPPGEYTAIAAGLAFFGLAIRTDGTIAYWGSPNYAVAAVPPGTFRAVSAGELYGLAIRDDGTLLAWGTDSYGTGVLNTPPGTFKKIDAGTYFAAAIRDDGTIVTWGQTIDGSPAPTPPPGLFREVGAGPWIGLALSDACFPNCDGSTIAPVLNVQDFACFLNQFAAGAPYANCDNSTTPPAINVLDFTCFLNAFANGCAP